MGNFINLLVLRTDLSGNPTFRTLLSRVRHTVLGALKHQDYPFSLLVERLQPNRDPSRSPLFQAAFVWEKLPQLKDLESKALKALVAPGDVASWTRFAEMEVAPFGLSQQDGQYDLALEMTEVSGSLFGEFKYNTDLFDASTIKRLAGHFQMLLSGAACDPEQHISSMPILTEAERHQTLVEWNDSKTKSALDRPINQLFESQVAQTPEAIAVVSEDAQLTYHELNCRANQLARALVECGVCSDFLVTLLAGRSVDLLTTILAVFKAGGAYLPLDRRYPASRLCQVLDQSESSLILTDTEFLPVLSKAVGNLASGRRPRLLLIEELLRRGGARENLPVSPSPTDLAYVIYTSGSTGIPKGVMVEHRGMLNHLYAKIGDLRLTSKDIVAQTASQSFDISVWQFLAALVVGGRVHVISDEAARDPSRLLAAVERQRISILETVPSMLQMILDHVRLRGDLPALTSLRWLISTGETLTSKLCRSWLSYYPHVSLMNAYGPTECSDDVTHYSVDRSAVNGVHMPIGRPIANMRVYVLDRCLQPVPVGVVGELYVGGIGVGRGYLNDPTRTASAFVPDPFAEAPGWRLFKTGDLGRYQPDGNIEFLGRDDQQVKLRGFRIELGEIEATLCRHQHIREAVVVVHNQSLGDGRLVAYVVPRQGAAPSAAELRSFLKDALPDSMIPAAFVVLESLPLTPAGKLDRKALPAFAPNDLAFGKISVPPRTQLEEGVARIWGHVLGLDNFGIYDNFFDLGGHSLLALQVISRLGEEFQVELPLQRLFETPTVAGLAESIAAARERQAKRPRPLPELNDAKELLRQQSSGFLTFERRPLAELVNAGEVTPVDAAALQYLPTSILEHLKLSSKEIIHTWFNNAPLVSSIVETSLGRVALLVLPRFASQLFIDEPGITGIVLQALEIAGRIGARSVSLTGLIPSATDYGRTLAHAIRGRSDLPAISTGHATTAAAVVLAIRRTLQEGGRDIRRESVGFLGLGSIGVSCLRLMLRCLPHPAEITLCDVYRKRASLAAMGQQLITDLAFKGFIRIAESQAEIPGEFYRSTLIIGATNVPNLIDLTRVQPGTLIVDDSAPHCFDLTHAMERFQHHRDILFTEGGVLRSPRANSERRYLPPYAEEAMNGTLAKAVFAYDPFEITGCVLSSLLSARFPELQPILGIPEGSACFQHYEMLHRLGFGASNLHCSGELGEPYVLTEESIRDFRSRFGVQENDLSKAHKGLSC
jgi:amino acid adenylation domain-containing protein